MSLFYQINGMSSPHGLSDSLLPESCPNLRTKYTTLNLYSLHHIHRSPQKQAGVELKVASIN